MSITKLSVAGVLFLGACGTSISTFQLRPISAAPRPPLSVDTFMQPPLRPYVTVARLEAHDVMAPSSGYMISKLRDRAAQLGCDGILIDPPEHHEDPHHVTHLSGMCIMFASTTASSPP